MSQKQSDWNQNGSGVGNGNGSGSGNADWYEELQMSRRIMQQYLGQLVMLFGICANSMNIAVLSQKRMRVTSTNCYLLVLAAYDVLFLVLSGFLNWSVVEFPDVKHKDWYRLISSQLVPLANLISNGAAWLVCAFTLERYIAVCKPMRGRVWCTTKRAKWIIAGVCCLSAAVTFPEFFPQMKSLLLHLGYYWLNSCLFTFIPILALSVFNSLLIHAVVQANRARKSMQEQNHRDTRRETMRMPDEDSRSTPACSGPAKQDRLASEQQKLTVMLIVVVIVFLVCQIPAALNLLFRSYLKSHDIHLKEGDENLRRIFGGFSNFLVQLNHASNFIVYSMFSTKFRSTFRRVFCRCSCNSRKQQPYSNTHVHSNSNNNNNNNNSTVHTVNETTDLCSSKALRRTSNTNTTSPGANHCLTLNNNKFTRPKNGDTRHQFSHCSRV